MLLKNVLPALFVLFSGHLLLGQQVTTLLNDPDRTFEAIHWHEDGRIYVVDFNNGRLYQAYTDGTIETLATGFSNLAGGGFDQAGGFYFSDLAAGTVHRLNDDGTTEQVASGLNQPTGILGSDDPDVLYVGQYGNNSVARVTISSGTVSSFVSANGISGPDGIIYDGEGNLLVANYNNNRISRVSSAGEVGLFATLPSPGIMGYITRAGGEVYVPSIAGNKIYRIDADGNGTLVAGSGTPGNADGVGEMATFNDPNGICSSPSGDTLLVTDGRRIRMITQFGPVRTAEPTLQLEALQLTPNPADAALTATFRIDAPQSLQWRILNAAGQVMQTAPPTVLAASRHTLRIDVDRLVPGTYHLQWLDEEGKSLSRKFLKH